ncbi:MAG: hypothetical protein O7B26_12490 [Planctomycetota bacterium]|nr:hypothetical protein [Planctomycetota bacterium]
MTDFVILAAQRTGSNLLCTLLNSHPEILCHHEIFNPRGPIYAVTHREGTLDFGSIEERDRDPFSFLDRVWRTRCGHSCVGFKMTQDQAEPVLQRVLARPSIKKIVLRRRNKIKTYVSQKISQRLDEWEVYDSQELAPRRPRVNVDVDQLREQIASNERFYSAIGEALKPWPDLYVEIVYESLSSRSLHQRLLDFLAVAARDVELKPASIKQNSSNLEDLVSNYAELASALTGSELEEELHARND